MGLIQRWLGAERQKMTHDQLMRVLAGSSESKSGQVVTPATALRVATVFACCRRIAGGIARLPFKLYQSQPDGSRRLATEHPLYRILSRQPNPRMTSYEWRETSMFHALLARGAYSYINRVRGEVRELQLLAPGSVCAVRGRDGFVDHYRVTFQDGVQREVMPSAMFRVPGPSWDGLEGLDMIEIARDAIGLAIATEESLAQIHKSGIRPSGILTTDGTLNPTTVKRVESMIQSDHMGTSKSGGLMVLDAGLKFQAMSLSAADSQSAETRSFQVQEIARMFEISPMMIGHPDKTATYASAEAFMQDFINNTLGPWVERWEQAASLHLLSEAEIADGYFAKLDVRGLLRGDAKTRAEFYKSAILTGWMTRNEAREKEDMNPIEGLDEPLFPLNMAAVSDDSGESDSPGEVEDTPEDETEDLAEGEPAVNPAHEATEPAHPGEVPEGSPEEADEEEEEMQEAAS